MPSIVETKAVSIRKGNHEENLAFTGVLGEVTADLGNEDSSGNLGTDANSTLRLHNGVTKGGIPMARADLANVKTNLLAENRQFTDDKNLAYADLSNLEQADDSRIRAEIKRILKSYGLADNAEMIEALATKVNVNTDNLNTANLTSSVIHDGVLTGDNPLAYANTSNINTSDLVDSQLHDGTNGNKPVSYNDFSNTNTTNLASPSASRPQGMTGPVMATFDFANCDTTNLTLDVYDGVTVGNRPQGMTGPVLARVDLANIEDSTLEALFNRSIFALEKTTNKDSFINESNVDLNHYPQTSAVISYVQSKVGSISGNYANTTLTNVQNWDILYSSSTSPIVERNASVLRSDAGFELGETYGTGIYLIDDEKDSFWVQVTSVDASGTIQAGGLSIRKSIGSVNLTSENPFKITSETNVDATFTITCTSNGNGTYTYAVDTITNGGSGFNIEDATHDGEYLVKSSTTGESYQVICNELKIVPTSINNGMILTVDCTPKYGFTNIVASSVTITSQTSTTADVSIASIVYNQIGAAGVAKLDFTNLTGMTPADKIAEKNSTWRVRHNESFPSTASATIPSSQDYTLATNGAIWRELKQEYYTKAEIDLMLQNI